MKIARIEHIVHVRVCSINYKKVTNRVPKIGFFFFGSAAPIGKNFLHFLFFLKDSFLHFQSSTVKYLENYQM